MYLSLLVTIGVGAISSQRAPLEIWNAQLRSKSVPVWCHSSQSCLRGVRNGWNFVFGFVFVANAVQSSPMNTLRIHLLEIPIGRMTLRQVLRANIAAAPQVLLVFCEFQMRVRATSGSSGRSSAEASGSVLYFWRPAHSLAAIN